jgi:tetratricopeptide (TPR) repeat protein
VGELLADGWSPAKEMLVPGVASRIRADSVHAYLELEGSDTNDVSVTYEVSAEKAGPALTRAASPGSAGTAGRKIFAAAVPIARLPPGDYVLRASISNGAVPVGSITRPFEIVAPAAAPAGSRSVARVWSGDVAPFMRRFSRDEALRTDVLKSFRDRVAPAAKTQFERGVTALTAADYQRAEAALKQAVRPDADSAAALAYLAVTFAASGRDIEAAGAWQSALIDGSDLPQIYDWLAQSLVRIRRPADARAILEEAVQKWPSDARFIGPLATVLALAGESRQAVAMLERYVAVRPADGEALRLGVEWMYQARASGGVVRSRGEDLALAKTFAEAYARTNGPESPLVKRWVAFLESDK